MGMHDDMYENIKSQEEIDKREVKNELINRKAHMIVNDFYFLILSAMKKKGFINEDIAKNMMVSKDSVQSLFYRDGKLSIIEMIELADAVGIDLKIEGKDKNE